MKLKDEFVTVLNNKGSVTVSVDTELFSGMIRGNETAALIMKCLGTETDINQIVNTVCENYDADPDCVKKDVEQLLDKLREINAINE